MAIQLDFTRLKPRLLRRKGIDVEHTFHLCDLERLSTLLADGEGSLNVKCDFEWPENGDILMNLQVMGSISVLCQRCLESFPFEWHSETILCLDEEEPLTQERFDEPYERVVMTHDGSINLIDIVTDEILLGLPGRHPNGCPQNAVVDLID